MAVLLALTSAVAYGLSDFVGGLASRRASAWSVALLAQASSALCAALLAWTLAGEPRGVDLLWGAVGGIGGGLGTGFLYRGLATGRMGVVAPVSAVGSALVPVLAGVVTGERPGSLVWMGIALAFPGIWLVSSGEEMPGAPSNAGTGGDTVGTRTPPVVADGLVDGLLAGLGFGVLFAALGQVPDSAGMWPLALAQGVAAIVVVLLAVALRASWVPREPAAAWGLVAGPLAATAAAAFLLAAQTGLLSIAAVLAALYPAVTVILAATVLRERIHRPQAVGLVLCGTAVMLVAAG